MILFLDFDGVLHPDAAFRTKRGIELRGEGELFMWSPILEKLLAECPQIKVVLSTSWVRQLNFRSAKKRLPESVQDRVIGATYHSSTESGPDAAPWMERTRWQQIAGYVARHKVQDWIALDSTMTTPVGRTISGTGCCTATRKPGWLDSSTTPP